VAGPLFAYFHEHHARPQARSESKFEPRSLEAEAPWAALLVCRDYESAEPRLRVRFIRDLDAQLLPGDRHDDPAIALLGDGRNVLAAHSVLGPFTGCDVLVACVAVVLWL